MSPPWISVVIPVDSPAPDLAGCLTSLRAAAGEAAEILVVAHGPERPELPPGPGARLLHQPGLSQAGARNLGLEQAQGQVVLFTLPGCQAPPDLFSRLSQGLAQDEVAGLGGVCRAVAGAGALARLSQWQIAYDTQALAPEQDPALYTLCAAFRRQPALAAGGFAPGDGDFGLAATRLCAGLTDQGYRLVLDPGLYLLSRQPGDWQAYLRQEYRRGKGLFLARRRAPGQAPARAPTRPGTLLQPLVPLLSLGLLAGLLPSRPINALTLALAALLLLYPLNRGFLRYLAGQEPGLLNQGLLSCLLRPLAWCAGMLAGALGRLGGAGN